MSCWPMPITAALEVEQPSSSTCFYFRPKLFMSCWPMPITAALEVEQPSSSTSFKIVLKFRDSVKIQGRWRDVLRDIAKLKVGLCKVNTERSRDIAKLKVGLSKVNSDTLRTCTDIDECEKFKDRKLCIGTCVNIPGSYTCECPKGYKLGSDKRVCIDIDECQHNVCAPQDACVNTRGGYKCYPITCAANYIKDPDHKARCKRLICDPRDNQCLLMPEQYSYQYMALVSNLPLSDGGIPLYKIKGPDWTAARADFSLKLLEVNSPPGVQRVDESYVKKVLHQNNLMELNLVKSVQGPQDVKLEVKMKLFHGNNLIGSVVVYIVLVVSEYPF